MLACWPWVWVAGFILASGLAMTLPLLGLASSSGTFDYSHGLWLFFFAPLEGVRNGDSSVFAGAQAEGF